MPWKLNGDGIRTRRSMISKIDIPPKFEDAFPTEAKLLQEVYASGRKPFKNNQGEKLYFPVGFSITLFKTQEELANGILIAYNDWKFAGFKRNDPCPCGSGRKFKKCHLKGS